MEPPALWGFGDVAQLGERQLCKLDVVGSSPIVSNEMMFDASPGFGGEFDKAL
jgi:hypothetical protein